MSKGVRRSHLHQVYSISKHTTYNDVYPHIYLIVNNFESFIKAS